MQGLMIEVSTNKRFEDKKRNNVFLVLLMDTHILLRIHGSSTGRLSITLALTSVTQQYMYLGY